MAKITFGQWFFAFWRGDKSIFRDNIDPAPAQPSDSGDVETPSETPPVQEDVVTVQPDTPPTLAVPPQVVDNSNQYSVSSSDPVLDPNMIVGDSQINWALVSRDGLPTVETNATCCAQYLVFNGKQITVALWLYIEKSRKYQFCSPFYDNAPFYGQDKITRWACLRDPKVGDSYTDDDSV